jgi:hypothetical protein
MRTSIVPFAVAAVVMLAGGQSAEAQVVVTGSGAPVTLTPGYRYGYASLYAGGPIYYRSGYVPPYSYYVLPSWVPSRIYIGPPEFPFFGQPYGHPYDRWTWTYTSSRYGGALARYYYPPLGF